MKRETLGWTIAGAVEPIGFFNSFSPSIADIQTQHSQSAAGIAGLRAGYLPALGLSLALGVGLSLLAKSPVPFLASAASSAYMVHSYEMALPQGTRLLDRWDVPLTPAPVQPPQTSNWPWLSPSGQQVL